MAHAQWYTWGIGGRFLQFFAVFAVLHLLPGHARVSFAQLSQFFAVLFVVFRLFLPVPLSTYHFAPFPS